MENEYNVYRDIATRTNGDIYIGVVGPVRCGKSTFITQFMKSVVLPNITDKFASERAIDELPQSADGKTIMTTQPRFVPNEAVEVQIGDVTQLSVRMIDCVGYLVDGAIGHEENSKPRLVKTPWSDEEIPFEEAAEIGTKKVIDEHSTIAIAMTCDGTISEIPRSSYIPSEERVVAELKANKKPFVIVLNSTKPKDEATIRLAVSLEQKYEVPVVCMNALEMDKNDVDTMFEKILTQFPVKEVCVNMPDWLSALPFEDSIIKKIIEEVSAFGEGLEKIGDVDTTKTLFVQSDEFESVGVDSIKMGDGTVVFNLQPKPSLFYTVLSNQCGTQIKDDFHLVTYIKELAFAKTEYDKLKIALDQVSEKGYGVVLPRLEEMSLEDPQIVKQGSRFGVKLKASAPSLHIMRVDIETEISPLVGTEQQSEEMVKFLMSEFENNPQEIWNTNFFGKSLNNLVQEGINTKISSMPQEAQKKMRRTLGRIINEGKGGIICILL